MKKKRNRGMTMVEIIVAFVMLTLVMGISYSSIRFASNLTKEAADTDKKNERFQSAIAEYYRNDDNYKKASTSNVTYSFVGKNEDGSTNGPYTFSIKTTSQSFKYDGVIYVPTEDTTGENVRNIFLFSTDD